MKKRVKKLVVIALTVALFVTSVLPALADSHSHHGDDIDLGPLTEGYTITLTKPAGADDDYMGKVKFGAYQIFSGTVDATVTPTPNPGKFGVTGESTALPITDIKWGSAFGIETNTASKTSRMKNIVGFALALGTVGDDFFGVDFDSFKYGSTDGTPLVEPSGSSSDEKKLNSAYLSDSSVVITKDSLKSATATDLEKVNYDKLAVAVASEIAKHNNREWLQAFADILGGYSGDSAGYDADEDFVSHYYSGKHDEDSDTYKIKVPAGYYMIIDQSEYTGTVVPGTDDSTAYSARMLFVAYDIEQEIKEAVPSLDKDVVRADGNEYNTEAAGVGDLVTFRLTGTLPSNYENYLEGYQYEFIDTVSKGMDVQLIDPDVANTYVTIKAEGGWVKESGASDWEWKADAKFDITKDSYDKDGTLSLKHKHITDAGTNAAYTEELIDRTLTVKFPCLEEIITKDDSGNEYSLGYNATTSQSSKIYVDYKVKINKDALVGLDGNKNEASLVYSNNPQSYGDEAVSTEVHATVFTFGLDIIKVDAAAFLKNDGSVEATGVALDGAEFALVRCVENTGVPTTYQWQIAKFEEVDAATAGTLGNIPADFKKSGYYTISEWVDITGGTEEKFNEDWITSYKNGVDLYNIATLNGGHLNVSGIDDGVEYTLVETKTPAPVDKYAKIKPFTVTVTATQINGKEYNGTLSSVDCGDSAVDAGESFSYDETVQLLNPTASSKDNDGSAGMYVANFKYENLPSTGGIGTWIFYIIGGVTVAGALVLFILAGRKSRKA